MLEYPLYQRDYTNVPLYRDHLSTESTFSWSLGWSLYAGFTVSCACRTHRTGVSKKYKNVLYIHMYVQYMRDVNIHICTVPIQWNLSPVIKDPSLKTTRPSDMHVWIWKCADTRFTCDEHSKNGNNWPIRNQYIPTRPWYYQVPMVMR